MKSLLFLVGGIGVAMAYFIAREQRREDLSAAEPVDALAHRLQDAWADHHTVA